MNVMSTETDWKPKPNTVDRLGNPVYHPDFELDSTVSNPGGSKGWEHAHVLPEGLLKDCDDKTARSKYSPPKIRRLPCERP